MPFPTDRGYVFVTTNPDGSTSVRICAAIESGRPVDVHAAHVGRPKVVVDPAVTLVAGKAGSYSDRVVEVSPDEDGVLHVRPASSLPSVTL